jgi:N-acetylglucosaminyldiphosphoundecaprenol N-acetyl-beta-D-mannosaminyltransferase
VGGASLARAVAAPVERTDLFGVHCFCGTLAAANEWMLGAALGGEGGYVCLMNVHVLETALRSDSVGRALAGARLVFPDGAPIAWLQRRRIAGAERVGGPDLLAEVLSSGRPAGLRHAFYGSTPEVLQGLGERVAERFPGAEVVSAISPPFGERSDDDVERDLDVVRRSHPHVVWVALGAPRQELWAARYASALAPALVVCVGAAFEFLAGTKSRAPAWMQEHGLEWLHRLAAEPRRLGSRYLVTNTRFVTRLAIGGARTSARRGGR